MSKDNIMQDESFSVGTEEYAARIIAYYDKYSESEKKIADNLIKNGNKLDNNITIGHLAKMTGASQATIVRFCRTLGFKGFAEFKFYMLQGILTHQESSIQINENDSTSVIKQKVAEYAKNTINDSIFTTDNNALEKAIEALSSARTVMFCGIGSAYGIAHSAVNIFMSLGISCYSISDPLTHLRTAAYMTPNDVVVGITNCGYIKDVVDTLMIAKESGATTICITSIKDALITKYADIILYTTPRNSIRPLDLPTISICQMITIHTLQIGVLMRTHNMKKQQINKLNQISKLKRYSLDLERINIDRVTFKK